MHRGHRQASRSVAPLLAATLVVAIGSAACSERPAGRGANRDASAAPDGSFQVDDGAPARGVDADAGRPMADTTGREPEAGVTLPDVAEPRASATPRLLLYPLAPDIALDSLAPTAAAAFVKRVEQMPGDGITVAVNQGTYSFYQDRIGIDVWETQLKKLAGVKKTVFVKTETSAMVASPPLFSDDSRWATIVANLRDLLAALKQHGFHWVNDNEPYPWAATPAQEYYNVAFQGPVHAKAYARGKQLALAINDVYPTVTVLTLQGPYKGLAALDPQIAYAGKIAHYPTSYELNAWFWAGMFEHSPQATHVDGGELYMLRPGEFAATVEHRRQVTRGGAFNSNDPRYDAWELGFGIYDATHPPALGDKMTPARFRQCTDAALAASTAGAWVWAYITSGGPAYTTENPWTKSLVGL